jgi:hypothetical protein
MTECFRCGSTDHLYKDCTAALPDAEASTADKTWCGHCDRQTRLVDYGAFMARCRRCWRLRSLALGKPLSTMLSQHKLCGGCRETIYEWDKLPCGHHQPLALPVAPHS